MPRMAFSLANEIADPLTVSLVQSSYDGAWPAENLRYPQDPFNPWRTRDPATFVSGNSFIFNRGADKPIGLVAGIRLNVQTVWLQTGHDAVSGLTTVAQLPVNQCPLTGRYQFAYLFPPGSTAWRVALYIPPQSTVAESLNTAETPVVLGGFWVGQVAYPPMNPGFDVAWTMVDARRRTPPETNAIAPRNKRMGHPRAQIKMNLRAKTDWRRPFVESVAGTGLRTYARFIGQLSEAGIFAAYENAGDTSMVFICQIPDDESEWQMTRHKRAQSTVTLEELT